MQPEFFFYYLAGSAFLAYVSRASLREPNSHGFYRFIAWNLMLIMFVINLNGWHDAPLTADQVICGILMSLSLLLVIASFLSLIHFGRPDKNRNDMPLLFFEKTTTLVTHGIYRYIRHPMYCSLISLDGGMFFRNMSWLSGCIALLALAFLLIAMLAEERENLRYFGTSYREYMKRSKRFIPFLF